MEDLSLGEIGRAIVRVEAKIDQRHTDHEQRIRRVEAWMYALPAAVVTAVAGIIISIIK